MTIGLQGDRLDVEDGLDDLVGETPFAFQVEGLAANNDEKIRIPVATGSKERILFDFMSVMRVFACT